MTNMLQFRTNVRISHRSPQRNMKHVCEDCVLFVWVDLHVSLCVQQQFLSCTHAVFAKPLCHPTPQTEIYELRLEIQTLYWIRQCSYELCLSHNYPEKPPTNVLTSPMCHPYVYPLLTYRNLNLVHTLIWLLMILTKTLTAQIIAGPNREAL